MNGPKIGSQILKIHFENMRLKGDRIKVSITSKRMNIVNRGYGNSIEV